MVVKLLITKLLAFPALVDRELVETLLAVSKLVLKVVVLRKGGTIEIPPEGSPVKAEPSPICLP